MISKDCLEILKIKKSSTSSTESLESSCIISHDILNKESEFFKALLQELNKKLSEKYDLETNEVFDIQITLPPVIMFAIYSAHCFYYTNLEHDTEYHFRQMKDLLVQNIQSSSKIIMSSGNSSSESKVKPEDKSEIDSSSYATDNMIQINIMIELKDEVLSNKPSCFTMKKPYHSNNKRQKRQDRQQNSTKISKNDVLKILESLKDQTGVKSDAATWFQQLIDDTSHIKETPSFTIETTRTSVYLFGQYNKYQRNISQSPFFADVAITSVSAEIINILHSYFYKQTQPKDLMKFHASGREDVNVRMLKNGRTFGLNICDASRIPTVKELNQIEMAMNNNGVGIHDLIYKSSSAFHSLQKETEEKCKRYGCVCWCQTSHTSEALQQAFNSVTFPLTIAQKTPIRVLHRRPNLVRERIILECSVEWINHHWFLLYAMTSSGAYVKEFVHGDFSRTNKSVSGILGGKVDIMQLDCFILLKNKMIITGPGNFISPVMKN